MTVPVTRILLFLYAGLVLCGAPSAFAMVSVGTPFGGAHDAPGRVEGEDFNAGDNRAAYYARTAGNQGTSGYRADAPDVDVSAGAGAVWVSTTAAADKLDVEWFNYTIDATQSGWFALTGRVRVSGASRLTVLVNDRALGNSPWLTDTDFTTVTLTQRIRLTAGTHVIKLVVRVLNQRVDVDWIELTPIAPPEIAPRLIDLGDEAIVADAVATDPPFNADPTGTTNAVPAIQAALDAVRELGGGVVYLPAGRYLCRQIIKVPGHCALIGEWHDPLDDPDAIGTLLIVDTAPAADDATAFDDRGFIRLAEGVPGESTAAVRNLALWWPAQDALDIRPWPWAIRAGRGHGCSVRNITLYNAYLGIRYDFSSAIQVGRLRGTPLRRGYYGGLGREYSLIWDVRFAPTFWAAAPVDPIANAPKDPAARAAVEAFMTENLIGLRIGENDALHLHEISVPVAHWGLMIGQIPGDADSYYGTMSKIDATIGNIGQPHRLNNTLHYLNLDDIPETAHLTHKAAAPRGPVRRTSDSLFVVTDFGADATGRVDDAPAIQAALDAAGAAGGGTVYLPQGQYTVLGRLAVPSGVELRGPCGSRYQGILLEPCVLTVHADRGTSSAPPFITLASGAGLRGFRIVYPEQGFNSPAEPIVPYPFCVRGEGPGVWLVDMHFSNCYAAVDFASADCSEFLIAGCWANALKTGFAMGGGSMHGRIERTIVTYGSNYNNLRQNSPELQGYAEPYIHYPLTHATAYRLGDLQGLTGISMCSWECNVNMLGFDQGGGGPHSVELWHPGGEAAESAGYRFEAGDQIHLLGPSHGGGARAIDPEPHWFEATSQFAGRVHVYDPLLWGPSPNPDASIDNSGQLKIYHDRTLVSGGPTTASNVLIADAETTRATDRNAWSKWVAQGPDAWLDVDLGQPCEVRRWVIRHAHFNPLDNPGYNTRAAGIALSDDGVNFATVDSFVNNARHHTDYGFMDGDQIDYRRARHARLEISEPTQPGFDDHVRLPEWLVYGRAGWHFRQGLEGWEPLNGATTLTLIGEDRLAMVGSNGDPQMRSANNLDIDLNRYDRVHVRIWNRTPSGTGQVFFATYDEPTFSFERSKVRDDLSTADSRFRDYIFDFRGNPFWTGRLKRLRFDPVTTSGTVLVDAIALVPRDAYTLATEAVDGRVVRSLDRLFYHDGTRVVLDAQGDPFYVFNGWTGDVPAGAENDNPLEVAMDRDRVLTAVFRLVEHTLTTSAAGGSVTRIPDLTGYPHGTSVSLTAMPQPGYEFIAWTGDVPADREGENPLVLQMEGPRTIQAIHLPFTRARARESWTLLP